jgi:hypothetical protein
MRRLLCRRRDFQVHSSRPRCDVDCQGAEKTLISANAPQLGMTTPESRSAKSATSGQIGATTPLRSPRQVGKSSKAAATLGSGASTSTHGATRSLTPMASPSFSKCTIRCREAARASADPSLIAPICRTVQVAAGRTCQQIKSASASMKAWGAAAKAAPVELRTNGPAREIPAR